ncbi:VanZ family protein [Propionicimonas sp.]|uniref:VanZ family protein n=1 Tax=Propionicimonas sp. TaxID=1955623 RepID=UPI0039E30671
MSNYFSIFLTPNLAINGAIILVVAIGLTTALRRRLGTVHRRLLFLLATVSLGGIVQVTLLRDPPNAACWECLTQWPLDRLISGQLGTDTALNIALFLPLGLFATLLWKAPFRVTGAAALLSLVIEIIQPLLGVGANDLADIAANTLGALLGAGLATTALLIRDAITSRQLDGRRLAKLAVTIAVTVGLALGISIGGADTIQASGARQLEAMFAGTTVGDYTRDQQTWGPKLEAFWKTNRTPTNDGYSDSHVALQRFTWTFYWTTRCVTAHWDTHGFTTELGSDSQCTQRLR